MRTLLQLAAALALLSLGVGAAVLVRDAHKLISDSDAAIRHADGALSKAEGEWQNEKADLHQILSNANSATLQAAAFAQEQRLQLAKTSRDSDNQVRAVGLVTRNAEKFFYNLDQQVNGKVLPDFDRELVATSTAAQFGMESITKAGDALTFQLNDPEWGQTLHGLNMTAASLASFSAHADDSMLHVDHTITYYDKKLTTPAGFAKTLASTVLNVGSQAGNIITGFVK